MSRKQKMAIATNNLIEQAQSLSDQGRVVEAIETLNAALETAAPDPHLLALRAQFHLQRRNYVEAEADLDGAIALSPGDAGLLAKRADLFALTKRLPRAKRDLDQALRLTPGDTNLRLARLRIAVRRGLRRQALPEIGRLTRTGSPRVAAEALFCRGCLDFKSRRPGLGMKAFRKLMRELPPDDSLSMRARFYWIASRVVDSQFLRRQKMKNMRRKPPRLFLCGLGIFPPYTASLEVLHAISLCDVAFNNVAGSEVADLLAEFCADIRPASYQAWQDEPRWADSIFKELDKGKKVAFVTRGHPLVFGGLAVELVRRCREKNVDCSSFGAVSSIDHLLAYTGSGLGDDFKGIQALDRPAIENSEVLNTHVPLLACFYSGASGKNDVAAFRRSLERFYHADHGCWMFGPKYDSAPVVLRLGDLENRFPEIHPSLMLYLPPA